jgi:hypothetical protein
MGRPLKIQKYGTNQGIGQYGAGVPVDEGFNMWSQLTNPVYPASMTASNFGGVVGGASDVSQAAYPVVKCTAYIPGDSQYRYAFIIRQKANIKYLVAAPTAIQDEDIVAGQTYYINTPGNTNWKALGGPTNASAGDVFTATKAGTGLGTTGVVYIAGVCTLTNDTTPASGFMAITMNINNDSTEITISKLTNKFALDYSDPPVRYATNFWTDIGTAVKSGTQNIANTATQQNTMGWGQVDNYHP